MSTKDPQPIKWIQLQINVFTRWVQNQLKNEKNIHIENITKDLSNGVALVELAKTLTQNNTPRNWAKSPKRTFEMVQNCDLAIEMFTKDGVNLVGISGKDVNDNNQKLILGLIWSLILYYSIGKSIQNDTNENKENTKENIKKTKKNESKALKSWAAQRIQNYPNINNFTPYELSICALLDSYVPSKINYYSLNPNDRDYNSSLATKVMNDLGIPIYIYPEDIKDESSQIDDKTLLTQLSSMKTVLEEQASKITAKNKRINDEKTESDSDENTSRNIDEENKSDQESTIKANSTQSNEIDDQQFNDEFSEKLFEENEIDQESIIKTDSTQRSSQQNVNDDQQFNDEFSNKLFEENEIDQESIIKTDSTQRSNQQNVNDDQQFNDEFSEKLFEENEIDQESIIKTDSTQQSSQQNENDEQQFNDEFSEKLFEENEIDQETIIKTDSTQQSNQQNENDEQQFNDEFSEKLYEENEIDQELRIKNEIDTNGFSDQAPELLQRSVNDIEKNNSNQLNDNLQVEKSNLTIDANDPERKSTNSKYQKLQSDKKTFSLKEWISKVFTPIKSLFNSQSEFVQPLGVIVFNSPITPFAYYIDYNQQPIFE